LKAYGRVKEHSGLDGSEWLVAGLLSGKEFPFPTVWELHGSQNETVKREVPS